MNEASNKEKGVEMKKYYFLAVAIVCLAILFAIPKPACAAPEKPIELRFSMWNSLQHHTVTDVYGPWAKELDAKTKGRVKIVFYPSEALGKGKDHFDLAVRGIADIAIFIHGYTPGRFPLAGVMELPLGVPSGKIGSRVMMDLYEKYMKQEYQGVKILYVKTNEPGQIQMSKKMVKTMADLKGLRLRSPGPQQMAVLRSWGVSPLTIQVTDLYDALQKGMADGALLPFSAIKDFKLEDVIKYSTISNSYVMTSGMAMNLKTWNNLPPDIQKIIDETTGRKMAEFNGAMNDRMSEHALEEIRKAGGQIYELPAAERKAWMEKAKPVCDVWVADMEKKGLPGKKVYEEAVALLDKYSREEASAGVKGAKGK
jgi:TRAP-type C4-dicarboxylate transport system substrate-binding protein